MTQPIQAYFRTENDAEDVRILLQKYDTEELEIGVMQGEGGVDSLTVPLAAGIQPDGSGSTGAVTLAGSSAGFDPLLGALDDEEDEADQYHYVLSVQVKDEEYDEVVQVIENNKGYVSRNGSRLE